MVKESYEVVFEKLTDEAYGDGSGFWGQGVRMKTGGGEEMPVLLAAKDQLTQMREAAIEEASKATGLGAKEAGEISTQTINELRQADTAYRSFSTGNSRCRACKAAYRKQYYEQTREIECERAAQWRQENRDRRNEYKRIYSKVHGSTENERRRHRIYDYKIRYGEFAEAAQVANELKKTLRELYPTPEQLRSRRRCASGYYREYRARRAAERERNSVGAMGDGSRSEGRKNGPGDSEDDCSGRELNHAHSSA